MSRSRTAVRSDCRQALQRLAQERREVALLEGGQRADGRRDRRDVLGRHVAVDRLPLLAHAAVVVDAEVAADADQPRLEIGAAVERVERLEDLEEDVLGQVLGLLVRADELVGDVEDLAPVLPDDLLPRRLIADAGNARSARRWRWARAGRRSALMKSAGAGEARMITERFSGCQTADASGRIAGVTVTTTHGVCARRAASASAATASPSRRSRLSAGTPAYVYSAAAIRAAWRGLDCRVRLRCRTPCTTP